MNWVLAGVADFEELRESCQLGKKIVETWETHQCCNVHVVFEWLLNMLDVEGA